MRRGLAGLLLLVAGFSAAQQRPQAAAVWISVPFVAQTKDGCGSASIAMVMRYWNAQQHQADSKDADPLQVQSLLFSPKAHGIYADRMQQYFSAHGYLAFAFQGNWGDLGHDLRLGRPLIVGLAASGPHGPLHYAVVVGVDEPRQYVYLNDPAQQKMLRISREGFEREWKGTDNWTLLAVPRPSH
jgi:predicted double-glycine peptidase